MRLNAAVFIAGAALMGLEIAGSRVLAPVFGTSVFVWGALITTFLASLALGYELGGRLADRRPEPEILARCLFVAALLVWIVFWNPAPILGVLADAPVPERFRSLLAAAVLFGPPSVLMGFVGPFAVRLATRDIARVGSAAGRLSAISTAGSILGTFAMTFFLIPAFPIRPILFGLGLSLLASAALIPVRSRLGPAIAFALGIAGSLVFLISPDRAMIPPPVGNILFEKETAYHHIRVVDSGLRRLLYFNNLTQGFVPLRDGVDQPPIYADGLMLPFAFRAAPVRSVVVIGLGAGLVERSLSAHYPEVETTTIEIDPEVVRVAEQYFRFKLDPNDRILIGDGRHELRKHVTSVDVIVEDAFFADSVPFHLMTREFFVLCRDRLSPDGIYVANLVGSLTGKDNGLFWAMYLALRDVFPNVYIFNDELASGSAAFRGNAIVVATRSRDRLDRASIVDGAGKVARKMSRPEILEWAGRLHEGEIRTEGWPMLTDAYSPTDALQHLSR